CCLDLLLLDAVCDRSLLHDPGAREDCNLVGCICWIFIHLFSFFDEVCIVFVSSSIGIVPITHLESTFVEWVACKTLDVAAIWTMEFNCLVTGSVEVVCVDRNDVCHDVLLCSY